MTNELANRLKAFNDRLIAGESFERITRTKCCLCDGLGVYYENEPCPACGGNGATERRERIDPSRVIIKDNL
jgi:DnaJ-class molecular chaperone